MITRLLPALLGLLLSGASLFAQSSVWKVTRDGDTLYLGGTVHLLRPGDFPLPAEFDEAFAASAAIVFETDLRRVRSTDEMQKLVTAHGLIADGKTLESILSPAAWKAVQEYCGRTNLPVAHVSSFKPWLFLLTITMIEMQKLGVSLEGVDSHYFDRASQGGKPTSGLATFEEHINHLINLGAGQEDELIVKSLEELAEIPGLLEDLIAAWRAGEVDKIDELMLSVMRERHPTIFKALVVERNAAWLPKLTEFLKTPEVEFVLVGVGHMPGPDGLLAQLRDHGCTIEQIKATPTQGEPVTSAEPR